MLSASFDSILEDVNYLAAMEQHPPPAGDGNTKKNWDKYGSTQSGEITK